MTAAALVLGLVLGLLLGLLVGGRIALWSCGKGLARLKFCDTCLLRASVVFNEYGMAEFARAARALRAAGTCGQCGAICSECRSWEVA